jgi:pyrimidine operon attenuation protein/uracil phosphoribosyltransferase
MLLPDAEALLADLTEQMRPVVTPETALVGIHTGGVWLARRLHASLGLVPPLGTLDVSFYRDDYQRIGLHPEVKPSDIRFDVAGRHIVIVDDVLFTGRTIRAAMNELFDYGRPESVRLAALVDRGGRELPICAQFIGATIDIGPDEQIELNLDAANRLSLALVHRPRRARGG